MKKTGQIISLVVCLTLALAMFGCSGRPEEQIQLTQKAMDQAQEQQAAEFAPNEWGMGLQAWKDADAHLAKSQWGEATTSLLKAKSQFQQARDIAKGKRDTVIQQIQGNQKVIELRYKGVKDNLEKAKLSPKTKAEVQDSCKEIDQGIEKLNAQFNQKELNQALFTSQTVMRQVYEAEKQIEGGGKKK